MAQSVKNSGRLRYIFIDQRQNLPYILAWLRQRLDMPVIHDFGAFKIRMFFEDHNPPHVHVAAADFEAQVAIVDGTILAGAIPPKFSDEALGWIAANKAMLMGKWKEWS